MTKTNTTTDKGNAITINAKTMSKAQKAWEAIQKEGRKTRGYWLAIGEALAEGKAEAGKNNNAFKAWKDEHFAGMDAAYASNSLRLFLDSDKVIPWADKNCPNLAHPGEILRKYRKAHKTEDKSKAKGKAEKKAKTVINMSQEALIASPVETLVMLAGTLCGAIENKRMESENQTLSMTKEEQAILIDCAAKLNAVTSTATVVTEKTEAKAV